MKRGKDDAEEKRLALNEKDAAAWNKVHCSNTLCACVGDFPSRTLPYISAVSRSRTTRPQWTPEQCEVLHSGSPALIDLAGVYRDAGRPHQQWLDQTPPTSVGIRFCSMYWECTAGRYRDSGRNCLIGFGERIAGGRGCAALRRLFEGAFSFSNRRFYE